VSAPTSNPLPRKTGEKNPSNLEDFYYDYQSASTDEMVVVRVEPLMDSVEEQSFHKETVEHEREENAINLIF